MVVGMGICVCVEYTVSEVGMGVKDSDGCAISSSFTSFAASSMAKGEEVGSEERSGRTGAGVGIKAGMGVKDSRGRTISSSFTPSTSSSSAKGEGVGRGERLDKTGAREGMVVGMGICVCVEYTVSDVGMGVKDSDGCAISSSFTPSTSPSVAKGEGVENGER